MRKAGFWKTDWFLGLIVSAVMFVLAGSDLVQSLERKAYDWGVRASSRELLSRIAVIAIDDASIANLGRWPWPRDLHAKMTDLLAGAKAKVVANTALFFEPQVDAGYVYVTRLSELHGELPRCRHRTATAPTGADGCGAERGRGEAEYRSHAVREYGAFGRCRTADVIYAR